MTEPAARIYEVLPSSGSGVLVIGVGGDRVYGVLQDELGIESSRGRGRSQADRRPGARVPVSPPARTP